MLRDRISAELAAEPDLSAASAALTRTDIGVYTEDFLVARPLLAAIRSATPTVLLVDEVDRTDEAMEAVMLEVLAERQVTVPELGTFTSRSSPWVILTSNDTRELSPALKRRCLHFQVGYPDVARECRIVGVRAPDVEQSVIAEVVDLARRLRDLPLRKSPSIAEVIDAARAASLLGSTGDDNRAVADRALLSLLVKFGSDLELARRELDSPSGENSDHAEVRTDGTAASGSVTATAFGAGRARSSTRQTSQRQTSSRQSSPSQSSQRQSSQRPDRPTTWFPRNGIREFRPVRAMTCWIGWRSCSAASCADPGSQSHRPRSSRSVEYSISSVETPIAPHGTAVGQRQIRLRDRRIRSRL